MTRYFVVKSKTDVFFQYGDLYYTDKENQNGTNFVLTEEGDNSNAKNIIISSSLLVEIEKEGYDHIKNASPTEKIETVREVVLAATSEKIATVRKGTQVTASGKEIPAILNYSMYVSGPSGETPSSLTQEDVWGEFDVKNMKEISTGMIVAKSDETCPHFGDVVPYKSVTVVCEEEQVNSVSYWLEYVHGGESVSRQKQLPGKKVAIRSDYQCW